MDYFYVRNHINNVGLIDIYAKAGVHLGQKSNIYMFLHNFSAAADLAGGDSKQLGTEIDLVYAYAIDENIKIMAGYSQLFASTGMEILKNNFDNNTNNWGWIMVTFKPTLFTSNNNTKPVQ